MGGVRQVLLPLPPSEPLEAFGEAIGAKTRTRKPSLPGKGLIIAKGTFWFASVESLKP